MTRARYDGEKFLSEEDMFLIYQGKLKKADAPELYEHLLDDDAPCPLLEADEGKLPHELKGEESETILNNILTALEPPKKEEALSLQAETTERTTSSNTSQSSAWMIWLRENLFHPMIWLPAALALFIIWQPAKTTPPTQEEFLSKGCKDAFSEKGGACRGAFFQEKEMKVIRRLSDSSQQTFEFQEAKFQVGDGILFRFRVVFPGYIYLIKQDERGHLEQLYPFEHHAKKIYPSPSNELMKLVYHGEEQIYVLEKKHVGRQTFWLIHTDHPIKFPQHVAQLNAQTRKYFSKSMTDYISFIVRPKKQSSKHPFSEKKG